jgi:hypothetical protein
MGVVEEPLPAGAEHAERSVRTSVVGPPNDRRVVALNILHGGGSVDRIGTLATRLLSYDADVIVVPEFRANRFGDLLTGRLQGEGYGTSHGARFHCAQMPGRLIESGYVDVWRSTHPNDREYSWFSPGVNNGFRIDHAYAAPELAQRVTTCEFDHTPRNLREADHSALIVSLLILAPARESGAC